MDVRGKARPVGAGLFYGLDFEILRVLSNFAQNIE